MREKGILLNCWYNLVVLDLNRCIFGLYYLSYLLYHCQTFNTPTNSLFQQAFCLMNLILEWTLLSWYRNNPIQTCSMHLIQRLPGKGDSNFANKNKVNVTIVKKVNLSIWKILSRAQILSMINGETSKWWSVQGTLSIWRNWGRISGWRKRARWEKVQTKWYARSNKRMNIRKIQDKLTKIDL